MRSILPALLAAFSPLALAASPVFIDPLDATRSTPPDRRHPIDATRSTGASMSSYSVGADFATINADADGMTFSDGGAYGEAQASSIWGSKGPGVNNLTSNGMLLTFDTLQTAVSFVFGGNTDNTVDVEVYGAGGQLSDTLTVTSSSVPADGVNNWIDHGIHDADGITSLKFLSESSRNRVCGFTESAALDAASPVPLPAGAALLVPAIAALGGLGLRRRRSAARTA